MYLNSYVGGIVDYIHTNKYVCVYLMFFDFDVFDFVAITGKTWNKIVVPWWHTRTYASYYKTNKNIPGGTPTHTQPLNYYVEVKYTNHSTTGFPTV